MKYRFNIFFIIIFNYFSPLKIIGLPSDFHHIPGTTLLLTLIGHHSEAILPLINHILISFLSSENSHNNPETEALIQNTVENTLVDIIDHDKPLLNQFLQIEPCLICHQLLDLILQTQDTGLKQSLHKIVLKWIKKFIFNISPQFRNQHILLPHLKTYQPSIFKLLSPSSQLYYHHLLNRIQININNEFHYGPLIQIIHALNHITHYQLIDSIESIFNHYAIITHNQEEDNIVRHTLLHFDLLLRHLIETIAHHLDKSHTAEQLQILFHYFETIFYEFPQYDGYLIHHTLKLLINTHQIDTRYHAIKFLNLLLQQKSPHIQDFHFHAIQSLINTPFENLNIIGPILIPLIIDNLQSHKRLFFYSWAMIKEFFETFHHTALTNPEYQKLKCIHQHMMKLFSILLNEHPQILYENIQWNIIYQNKQSLQKFLPAQDFITHVFSTDILILSIFKINIINIEMIIALIKLISKYHPKFFEYLIPQIIKAFSQTSQRSFQCDDLINFLTPLIQNCNQRKYIQDLLSTHPVLKDFKDNL